MFNYGKDHLTASIAISIMKGNTEAVIDQTTRSQIDASYKIVAELAAGNKAVYGINTGFGPLCNTRIDGQNTSKLQRNILISHSVGVGAPIENEIAKLMLILKVHALSKAYSGISLEILDRIIWHIENDVIPIVPEKGSVGASGDLAPLSHLFLPLIGEGEVMYKGDRLPTKDVLQQFGMSDIKLTPKSGLALINGTQFITANAVLFLSEFYNCLAHADVIAALMVDGLKGSDMPFHPKLHQTRPFKGNAHVANRLSALIEGSEILESHKDCDRVQDPYSLRCVPQVHGASRHAWLHLKELLEIEINSVTDNPVIISKDLTISGGNFHGQPMALPIDYACLAASELGNISDRRSYLSLEGKYEGIPKLLLQDTGLNSGFMILQYTAAALASENKGLCFPSSADSIPTSLGQEDHVSMGSIGVRKALRVVANLKQILAIELLCAAQALDFNKPLKSSEILELVHKEVRKHIDHATKDRLFAIDIKSAAQLIESRKILEMVAPLCSKASEYHQMFESF